MRVLDWPERLAACIEAAHDVPFAWGSHDCVLWACDVVKELTGTDPAERFRGQCDSAFSAIRLVQEIHPDGFEAMIRMLAAEQGYSEIPPAFAQRGDLVLCPSGLESWPHALGICIGIHAMMTGISGLVRVSMTAVVAAWRIV